MEKYDIIDQFHKHNIGMKELVVTMKEEGQAYGPTVSMPNSFDNSL